MNTTSTEAQPPVKLKPHFRLTRNIRYTLEALLAIAIGVGLSTIIATVVIVAHASQMMTVQNGWYAFLTYPEDASLLDRAAIAYIQPAANTPEEAVYLQTTSDAQQQTLNGANTYVLHFAPDSLPPNDAFWSLTITDTRGRMVANSIDRNSLNSYSEFAVNADGSVDFYIQSSAPAEHQSNWLPAPEGDFKLWLRIYQPSESVLCGEWRVPPVQEVN